MAWDYIFFDNVQILVQGGAIIRTPFYLQTFHCCWAQDVDYEATLKAKLEIAKKMFHLEKDKVLNLPSFKQYFEENKVLYFSMKVL
jgi:hypothetical protein